MPYDLDIQQESLSCTLRYSRPAFELWGLGGAVVGGLYGVLSSHGVPLQNFQVATAISSAADFIFTVRIGQSGVLKFALDRMEFGFVNFSEEVFRSIPHILDASTRWIKKAVQDFSFASHSFIYFNHSHLKGSTVEHFLATINTRNLNSAGISIGNGAVFNYRVPEKNWTTQIVVDRSVLLAGAVYLSLALSVPGDMLDYVRLLGEARYYLGEVLRELDLNLPELLLIE